MSRLKLFGGARLCADTTGSDMVTHHHHLALLALLSLSPDERLSREKLVAYLWPEHPSVGARHLLNTAAYHIRSTLGKDALVSVGDDLQLGEGAVETDAAAFLECVAQGRLADAVDVYDGPFLDGFFLDGSHEFQRWIERKRQYFSFEYGRVLEHLAAAAHLDGRQEDAVEWWLRLSQHDPYNSRVAVGFMRSLAAAGNPAGAVLHGMHHQRVLSEDLEMEAAPAVKDYLRELRSAGGSSSGDGAPRPGV